MPSRSFPVGATSIPAFLAVVGAPTSVDLTATGVTSGTGQNGYKMPTDVCVITKADGSNTAVTLPDPYLQGWNLGDWVEIVNTTSQACIVFPCTGGYINNGSLNASAAVAASNVTRLYVSVLAASGASKWVTLKGA